MREAVLCRYFNTYSGVTLPLRLSAELDEAGIHNRNTYFRGHFDADGRLLGFEKLVYGEVELMHRYTYDGEGRFVEAEITDADGEVTVVGAR